SADAPAGVCGRESFFRKVIEKPPRRRASFRRTRMKTRHEFHELLRLVQYGDGARRSRRFNVHKQAARKMPSPLALFMLKRRERRAPLTPESCHPILRTSITRIQMDSRSSIRVNS